MATDACPAKSEWLEPSDRYGWCAVLRNLLIVLGLFIIAPVLADVEALWRHTPGQRKLARIVRLPVLRTLARGLYNGFAACLYAWNRAKGRWEIG